MHRYLVFLLGMISCLGIRAQHEITRETDVYSVIGKDTLKIDVFYDKQAEVKPDGRPVMIYIHGGGFTMGDRVNAAQEVFCRYMAKRGWLAASVDYRLAGVRQNPDGTFLNPYNVDGTLSAVRIACSDVVDATNYLLQKADWKANPAKVCLGGGSAGAITALQIVYDACNDEEYTRRLPEGFAYAGAISQAGCICTPMNTDTLTWKRQPCPIMFFHGSEDALVPIERGQIDCRLFGTLYITRQMKQMGTPYWKWIERGADHVMAMKPLTTYLEEQYRFLNDFCVGGLQSSVNTEVEDRQPASMSSVEQMVKYVPLYILGYGKYLDQIDWDNMQKPDSVVY